MDTFILLLNTRVFWLSIMLLSALMETLSTGGNPTAYLAAVAAVFAITSEH